MQDKNTEQRHSGQTQDNPYRAYRRKKFNSVSMNYLHEKFLRGRKKIMTALSIIRERGTQKLSMMFIPHSERRVFNLQFSHFSLIILSLILLVTVLFSIISLNEHETATSRLDHLTELNKNHQANIDIFRNSTDYTIQNYSRLSRQLRKLRHSIQGSGMQNKAIPMAGLGGADLRHQPSAASTHSNISIQQEIKQMGNLHNSIKERTDELEKINKLVHHLKNVMEYVPSLWPVVGGGFVTSPFGNRIDPFTGMQKLHTGIDIAWWPGSPIRATASGVVELARNLGPYGLCVVIRHKHGFYTRYAHMQNTHVRTGDIVQRGQIIGSMGNTGKATGYHVHYEVMIEKHVTDPEPYLTSKF